MDYCIFILSIYGNPEKKMLNGKKSSLFVKNEIFCSVDLKVYKHLQTYKTHLHTKFGRILNCLSGILGAFSGILHNLEMF